MSSPQDRPRVGALVFEPPSSQPGVRAVEEETVAAARARFPVRVYTVRSGESRARLRETLRELLFTSDVVLGYTPELLRLRREEGLAVPLVFHGHGTLPYGAYDYLPHAALFRGDSLMLASTGDLALFDLFYTGERLRAHRVPFGVDTDRFRPASPEARAVVRRRLAVPDGVPLCFCVARLIPQKNVHLLLHLLRYVLDRTPAVLAVVGGPDRGLIPHLGLTGAGYEEYLDELIRRLDLRDHVRLLGRLERVGLPELYGAADLLVNLTVHGDENFGVAQVEAMACGVPVVGTHWGGLRDTIRDGVTGVGVPLILAPGSVQVPWREAAHAVASLLLEPERRAALARSAHRTALDEYSLPVFHRRVCEVIELTYRASRENPVLAMPPAGPLPGVTETATRLILLMQAAAHRPPARRGESIFAGSPEHEAVYQAVLRAYAGPTPSPPPARSSSVPYFLGDTRLTRTPLAAQVIDPACPRTLDLAPLEWRLAASIDGRRTVEQVERAVLGSATADEFGPAWERLLSEGLVWLDARE
ncbi:MAG TPA: glycosyltransferase family 4 protein [Armatimonadota bacterium]|nr:glycosyltransferase family 4 protein [Armatimonadota bacterium]